MNLKTNYLKVTGILIIILLGTTTITLFTSHIQYKNPGPYSNSEEWNLVLFDDFEEDNLNTAIWSYGYPPASWNCYGKCHNHQGWFAPENVLIEDGILRIKGENKTHPDAPFDYYWAGDDDNPLPLNYTTGAINSKGKFDFQYGYLEARLRMPEGPTGFWPAFWTFMSNGSDYSEIDIIEWYSDDGEDNYHTNLHTKDAEEIDINSTHGHHYGLGNLSKDFHTYGVDWQPDKILFYFDNHLVEKITNQDQLEHMEYQHIRINLAIGRGNAAPDENTIWPAWFECDWVKLWQKI